MYEQTPDAGAATERKALAINLDRSAYGAFAEIGAGQEVVRHFFKAGGASGTVAKSMSAYDMRVSDAIFSIRATPPIIKTPDAIRLALSASLRANTENPAPTKGAVAKITDSLAAPKSRSASKSNHIDSPYPIPPITRSTTISMGVGNLAPVSPASSSIGTDAPTDFRRAICIGSLMLRR